MFGFTLSVSSVFAGWFSDNMTEAKFLELFGPTKIGWFNWILYLGLIAALSMIIKEVGLKDAKLNKRTKGLIGLLISFMGITGIMWIFIQNKRTPDYLMLFAAEIFVLVLVGLIVKSGFKKDGEHFAKPIQFRIFVIFLAFILINGFHSLLLKMGSLNKESILYDMANTINFQIPIALYIIIYILVIYFFSDSEEKLDPEEKERRKKIKNYKKLLGLLVKEAKEAENLMSDLSGMLNSHIGGRK